MTDEERYEIHQYFNSLVVGLGDLLFQESAHSIHGKLNDMGFSDRSRTIQNMQDFNMIMFCENLETIASRIPTELETSGSLITIPDEEWDWLLEKLGSP